jgi:tRNA A37 threonylcarbamoyladenosine modification protein TsaB
MAAMTLAHALHKPVLGVHGLLALCDQAPTGTPATVAAIDARRDRVFGGVWTGRAWRVEPALCPAVELARHAPEGAGLIGSGVPCLLPHLVDRDDCVTAPEDDWRVRAVTVARRAADHPERAGRPEDVQAIYFH